MMIERSLRTNLNSEKSHNLDCLRAIAVCCVLIGHLGYARFQGKFEHIGAAGVMLFFVHTSLVLLRSLDRSGLEGPARLKWFYIRRVFRIYPLSIMSIALVAVFRLPSMPLGVYRWLGTKALLSDLALVQNITHTNEFLGPLWSLPWEVQMYVALPFLYVLLLRFPKRYLSIWLMVAMILVRTAAAAISPSLAYYVEYIPCFLGGMVAFQLGRTIVPRLHHILWVPFILLSISIWYLLWEAQPKAFGHPMRSLTSYALCSVVGLSLNFFKDIPNGIFARGCFVIAKYSFGIYLLHVPAMYIAFIVMSHYSAAIQWLILCVLMAALPWLACRYVEEPMIGVGRLLGARVTRESVLHAQLVETRQ